MKIAPKLCQQIQKNNKILNIRIKTIVCRLRQVVAQEKLWMKKQN